MVDLPDYTKAVEDDPAVVKLNASPVTAWVGVAFRQLALVGGSLATISQFVKVHDIRGLFTYMATHEFLATIAVIIGLGSVIYGYVREWLKKQELVQTALTDISNITIKNLK